MGKIGENTIAHRAAMNNISPRMSNQHKASKRIVPVRLEQSEISQLKKEARRRKLTLADLIRKIATGEIPLADEPDNLPPSR